MSWFNKDIAILPRNNDFPFQVQLLYYCNNWVVAQTRSVIPLEQIEFSFRLGSTADICCDEINGKPLNVKFPHLLIKHPGDIIQNAGTSPRDTISFHYHASTMPLYVEILPKDRYGQFCSAQALFRATMMFVCNAIAGVAVNFFGYRFLFVWDAVFTIGALAATVMLYRAWLRHGGPGNYVAP